MMRKLLLISCLAILTGCGEEGGGGGVAIKMGDQITGTKFVLIEDARQYETMEKCVGDLKFADENHRFEVDSDSQTSKRVHVVTGHDAEGHEFQATCTEAKGGFLMRVAKQ